MGGSSNSGWTMREDNKPSVAVIGLGYIGLPTAAVIARSGCQVTGVDISQAVVDTINRGEIHIEEADLDGLVQAVVQRDSLRAATEVAPAEVFVIAVPTPFCQGRAAHARCLLCDGCGARGLESTEALSVVRTFGATCGVD